MSLDKQAIEHIEANAVAAQINLNTNIELLPVLALPTSVVLHSIEKYAEAPRHFKGRFTTSIVGEFTDYCNTESDSDNVKPAVFIDEDSMSATATFDFGKPGQPQHRFHTAELALKRSADFMQILRLDDNQLTQKQFAELIEEHHANLATLGKETTIGAGAPSIDINKAVNAIRNMTIKAKAETGSRIEDLSESQSAFASIDVDNSEGNIPAYIDFKCIPYKGLKLPFLALLPGEEIEKDEISDNEHRVFRLHISILTGGEKPTFSLKLRHMAEHEEIMATAFKDQLIANLSKKSIVRIGTFS